MNEKNDFYFSFSPRLLLLLGDQLIRDDTIALTELVKNSYDADADSVKLTFNSIEHNQLGKIVIEDNGQGMNKEIIKNVWLKPGTDYKKKKFENKQVTQKYNRLPLGEKGVGRLGAHKLGSKIEIISKTESDSEIYLQIDWKKFEDVNDLDDVKITVEERETPKYFKSQTGTKITITGLKNDWSRKKFREVYLQILGLKNPFKLKNEKDKFDINVIIDKEEWLDDLLTHEELDEFKLFDFYCKISENKIDEFKYSFKPWSNLNKVEERIITEKDLKDHTPEDLFLKKYQNNKKEYISLDKNKVGTIIFKGSVFDRDNKLLSKYPLSLFKKQSLELLNEIYGIRVFRDGLRIYDYGEKGNDWLNLDHRRVNQPAMRISNNLVLGSVEISRGSSSGLIEKTNREGFIENHHLDSLKNSLLYCIGLIERERIKDKEKLRTMYIEKSSKKNIETTFDNIKEKINQKVEDSKDKKELLKLVGTINKDFVSIKQSLIKGASNGLSLSIVIHEIEKINKEIEKAIEVERPSVKLVQLFEHLKNMVNSYTTIIKGKDKINETLSSLVRQALFNINFRIESHNIEVINECTSSSELKIVKSLVLGTILNLFDNSIYWLDYQNKQNKKIFLKSYEEEEFISLLIADNGPGFNLDSEVAIKPFISGKPNDSGMGIGLHLAEQVMQSHNGSIEIIDSLDDLPNEFKNGAKIMLRFKK